MKAMPRNTSQILLIKWKGFYKLVMMIVESKPDQVFISEMSFKRHFPIQFCITSAKHSPWICNL